MVVLVCGGRGFSDEAAVAAVIDTLDPTIDVLIHGTADGADAIAGRLAYKRGIHTAQVAAMWRLYGRKAGPLRNAAMLRLRPDLVLAFPGGKGTENCIRQAEALGIPVERVGES